MKALSVPLELLLLCFFLLLLLSNPSVACEDASHHHHLSNEKKNGALAADRQRRGGSGDGGADPAAAIEEEEDDRRRRSLGEDRHFTSCGNERVSESDKLAMAVAMKEWQEANDYYGEGGGGGGGDRNRNRKRARRKRRRRERRRSRRNRSVQRILYKIPVHFHVIQQSATVGRVSDDEIRDGYLGALNAAFANTPFRFELDSVDTIISPDLYQCSFLDEDEMKNRLYKSGTNHLNVYVCDPYTNAFLGSYGWSSLPVHAGTVRDGVVVINPQTAGEDAAYTIIVHEVRLRGV